jgi:lactate dehydrogenase-like 2-hydroxyacid dehydrogenase
MKPELLVIAPVHAPALDALSQHYTIHRLWQAQDRAAFLDSVAPRIRGLITPGAHGFAREHIEPLPKLEIVGVYGRGHAAMDLASARARDIVVANTPDRTVQSTADVAMGLILATMRRICAADRFVRAGLWETETVALGRDLAGKTCGIVGFGHIGAEVAKRAAVFDMSVAYHGLRKKPDVSHPYYGSLEALARETDCLVVTCLLTPETRGIVNAGVLEALGPDGFLVNVARGPIVEEAALIVALQEQKIAGAGLDVYWDEPRVPDALRSLDNVVLTPHIGTTTRDNRDERTAILLTNLRAHFAGEQVPNAVE